MPAPNLPEFLATDNDRCRSCGGPLQILDATRTQSVTCVECADIYDLSNNSDDECVTGTFPKAVREEVGGDV